MSHTAVDICRDLIRCPSVTPEDAGALGRIEGLLRPAGFDIHRITFSEPDYPDIGNLYARIGTEGPCLLFAGHTDVVPPGDAQKWRFNPFSAEIADGMMWGRGAVDMKGGVAASIAAVLAYIETYAPIEHRQDFKKVWRDDLMPEADQALSDPDDSDHHKERATAYLQSTCKAEWKAKK